MVTYANPETRLPPNERRVKLKAACEHYDICRRTLGNMMKRGLRVERFGLKLLYTTLEEVGRHMRPVEFACVSPVPSQSEMAEVERVTQEARRRFGL